MRSLIVAAIFCLLAAPAFACILESDCKPGFACVDGDCRGNPAGDAADPAPAKRTTAKSCEYDSDCKEGASCVRGSGLQGVCLGR